MWLICMAVKAARCACSSISYQDMHEVCECREGFPHVRQVLHQVVDHLQHVGPHSSVDIDNICSGAMWDVVGELWDAGQI